MAAQTRLLWYVLLVAALGLFIVIAYLPGRDVPGDINAGNVNEGIDTANENSNQASNGNTAGSNSNSVNTNSNNETTKRSASGNLEVNQPIVHRTAAEGVYSVRLEVTGKVLAFENAVAFKVKAADGTLIKQTSDTATGEMGTLNPFETTILFGTTYGNTQVTLEVYTTSARDGSITDLVTFPLDVK